MQRIGIVTGVLREVAALGAPVPRGLDFRVSGANAARAYQEALALAEAGAEALLSFGLAGGLNPNLGPGAIVIGTEVLEVRGPIEVPKESGLRDTLNAVFNLRGQMARAREPLPPVSADARFEADRRLIGRLAEAAGRRALAGPLIGVDHIVRTRAEKSALLVRTRGFAVDMESQGVARAASDRGLPFGALRVVLDPSNRELPEPLARTVKPDGSTRLAPMLTGLLVNPLELGAYLSLAFDSAIAFRVLGRVGRRLGPALLGGL